MFAAAHGLIAQRFRDPEICRGLPDNSPDIRLRQTGQEDFLQPGCIREYGCHWHVNGI